MVDFAIHPPVHFSDGHQIDSTAQAASIVREYATRHCSLAAAALLHRIDQIETGDEAASIALELRSWAAREGLLRRVPAASV